MHLYNAIDIQHGLMGGVILGISSTIYLFLTGRITGISGIVENALVSVKEDDQDWPMMYLLGLVSSGYFLSQRYPEAFGSSQEVLALTPVSLIVAGILTGFGTRMGSGCTSGHGLCGLARLSLRSLVAVCTFMAFGAITAYITRDTELANSVYGVTGVQNVPLLPSVAVFVVIAIFFRGNKILDFFKLGTRTLFKKIASMLACFGLAFLFGIGLGVSGMCNPSRVIHFLDFTGKDGWDFTLMGVMGGGVIVNLIGFNMLKASHLAAPLCNKGSKFSDCLKIGNVSENIAINWKLILGSALFGMGWGLGGVCPGPGLVAFGASVSGSRIFVPSMIIGIAMHEFVFGNKGAAAANKPKAK